MKSVADAEPANTAMSAVAATVRNPGRLLGYLARNPVFAVALPLAVALRVLAMIGFQPFLWFNDSVGYLGGAENGSLSVARPSGYSILLRLLKPLHSLVLISAMQHVLGLSLGVAIYLLLRRRGLPDWAATLPALPVLFDAYEIQLEHLPMADTLFIALVTWAVVILTWNDQVRVAAAAVAGLLIGFATVVRSVGLPLIAVIAICLLIQRVGWRHVAALVLACAAPVLLYMTDYDAQHGSFGITGSTGVFLYDRAITFANCAVIKPPANLARLCDPRPQSERAQPPIEYIWDRTDPIYSLTPDREYHKTLPSGQIVLRKGKVHSKDVWTRGLNRLTEQFAERAILAQPLSYLHVVASDTLRSFYWGSPVPYDPSNQAYLFNPHFTFTQAWVDELRAYQPGFRQLRIVRPVADFLQDYQNVVYTQGPLLAAILLIGLAGIWARRRQWGGPVLLAWVTAVLLIVLPPMTTGFDSRYVLAAVPLACLAAGLAVTKRRPASSCDDRPDAECVESGLPPRSRACYSVGEVEADAADRDQD